MERSSGIIQPRRGAAVVALCVALFAVLELLRVQTEGVIVIGSKREPLITLLFAALAVAIGIALVRTLGEWVGSASTGYVGAGRSRTIGRLVSGSLYIFGAVVIASQAKLDLSGIALSGAATGVVLGIAAQASLANSIAGLVILFARPYRIGQYVTVRAAAFAGSEYSGEVADISLFFTTLLAGVQEIRVPNSSMIASVVVLRPQALDVYVPLILPLARWESMTTTGLIRQITEVLPAGRHVTASVERLEGGSIQIGIRASVADEMERSTVERALLRIVERGPSAGEDDGASAGELHDL